MPRVTQLVSSMLGCIRGGWIRAQFGLEDGEPSAQPLLFSLPGETLQAPRSGEHIHSGLQDGGVQQGRGGRRLEASTEGRRVWRLFPGGGRP